MKALLVFGVPYLLLTGKSLAPTSYFPGEVIYYVFAPNTPTKTDTTGFNSAGMQDNQLSKH